MKHRKPKRPSGSAQRKALGRKTVVLDLDPALVEKIDAAALADARSRNNWIRVQLEKLVG